LTAVCLEQRRRVIETLARHGVEAQCVVVADDRNLDTARALGFATVRRENDWLDTKFNDGMEYAGRQGAEWIVPIGSDSWIDPAYFLSLPAIGTRTSPLYCAVEPGRMVEISVGRPAGAGPYVFHRSLLEPSGFRPAGDGQRQRGIDGATITGIEASTGRPIDWQSYNLHGLQYVGFRGTPHITAYEKLKRRWGVRERRNPWPFLNRHYGVDIVIAARLALQKDAASQAA